MPRMASNQGIFPMPNVQPNSPIVEATVVYPCPCCGWAPRIEESPRIQFDYEKGLVYKKDIRIFLSPSEADVLKILFETWPKYITRVDLETRVYGKIYHEHERPSGSTPPVFFILSKLRRKIKPLGLQIPNVRSKGWRLSS